jgi:hydrogenase/urease accessory protein HupE
MPHHQVTRSLTRLLPRTTAAVVLAGTLVLVAARPALAHGISGEASERSTLGFISVGIEHMLLGWDHLLFVAGVLLLARTLRLSAKLISIFALGHSLTLICATIAGWHVNADLVDIVIVLSVAFVGAVAMIGQPKRWDWFAAVVFAFGLIHGLGLATRLQGLGLPGDGLIWKVICFNIGVEIGQVTAIVGMLGVAAVVSMTIGQGREQGAMKVAAVALFAIGSMVAPQLALKAFKAPEDSATRFEAAAGSTCEVGPRTVDLPATGEHTDKRFYGPDEVAPLANFGHSLGDGFVVILYPAQLEGQDVDELRDMVENHPTEGVLAGASDDSTVRVLTGRETLTCGAWERSSVEGFSRLWFRSMGYDV